MGVASGYTHAFGITLVGVVLVAGGFWAITFRHPGLLWGVPIAAGIAIGGSYVGVGGVGIVSRVVDTELLPFVAAGIGVLIGFGSFAVVFGQPPGDRVWLLLGLAILNGQILLGAGISETERSVTFIAEAVAVFVLTLSYLAASTASPNLDSFLIVSTVTTLLFVIFGWPLYQFGNTVTRSAS